MVRVVELGAMKRRGVRYSGPGNVEESNGEQREDHNEEDRGDR